MSLKHKEPKSKLSLHSTGAARASHRTHVPPTPAEGAPPGVCASRERNATRLAQAPESPVVIGPVCEGVEDLFVAAGLFDDRIVEVLVKRRRAFGLGVDPLDRLWRADPELKPRIVGRG
jgi:hypothetical protein